MRHWRRFTIGSLPLIGIALLAMGLKYAPQVVGVLTAVAFAYGIGYMIEEEMGRPQASPRIEEPQDRPVYSSDEGA